MPALYFPSNKDGLGMVCCMCWRKRITQAPLGCVICQHWIELLPVLNVLPLNSTSHDTTPIRCRHSSWLLRDSMALGRSHNWRSAPRSRRIP